MFLFIPVLAGAVNVSYAWWVNFMHEPKSTSFDGVKANRYKKGLSKIEIFSCETHEVFSENQCDEISKNGGRLSLNGDFDNDGINELWNVGVAKYKKKDANYPYATVVLIRDAKSKKLIQVLTIEQKKPGFAAFFEREKSIQLFFCMECGDYADIEHINGKWVAKWPEPY